MPLHFLLIGQDVRSLHTTLAVAAMGLHAAGAAMLEAASDYFVDLLENVDDLGLRVDFGTLLDEHHDALVWVETGGARDARVRYVHPLPLLSFRYLLES